MKPGFSNLVICGFCSAALVGAIAFVFAWQVFGGKEDTIAAEKFGSRSENVVPLSILLFMFVINPLVAALAVWRKSSLWIRLLGYFNAFHFPLGTLCAYALHTHFSSRSFETRTNPE